jgi:DNA-binding NarL/FixJ family response regulator
MRIAVIEDHEMFREIIVKLCCQLGHNVVASVGSCTAGMAAIAEKRPDIAIVDLSLPDGDGFQVIIESSTQSRETRFLVVSCHCSPIVVDRVQKLNVSGFVDKNSSSLGSIEQALAVLEAGQRYFSQNVLDTMVAGLTDRRIVTRLLSQKELDVLSLIAHAFDDVEIGTNLGMSPKTAKTHRGRILKKLDITSTAKLVAFAIHHGFNMVSPSKERVGSPV